jgi:UDP-2-acetamido-3-amino-2,3-dideoxy-glucuronate N-acetyltransferase
LYEKTILKRGCTIGANATIVCGITIGRYAFIAAGSVVAKDVPDYALVIGVPGKHIGWMSRHGHKLAFDAKGHAMCPESGFHYKTEEQVVHCLDLPEETPLPESLKHGSRPYLHLNKL